jgi:serine/threonine protein kinase
MQTAHESRFLDDDGFEQTGVLHGDLKPTNILVRAGDAPVLLDFMLADLQRLVDSRFREEREAESRQRLHAALSESIAETSTLTGMFGTPGFMSWEQEQQGIVTARSDIYSLGVTFCLLFFPAVAEGVDEVGFNHRDLGKGRDLKSVLDPNSGAGRNASRRIFGGSETLSLRGLLGRMISDDELQRPVSMRAIAEELESIQNEFTNEADEAS